jgi:hypothetical protein
MRACATSFIVLACILLCPHVPCCMAFVEIFHKVTAIGMIKLALFLAALQTLHPSSSLSLRQ